MVADANIVLTSGIGAALFVAVFLFAGAVMVNSAIMELPTEKDGRFAAFAAGAFLYSLLLLPLA